MRNSEDETGGLLFGQFDEMLGISWVTHVSGPPEDSTFSAQHFVCGIVGINELAKEFKKRSGGAVQYIGTWHSHPISGAQPSEMDHAGIAAIFAHNPEQGTYQAMMIVGYADSSHPQIGLYAYEKQPLSQKGNQTAANKDAIVSAPELPSLSASIGLALSGGGSRAVAFHLGTLRALNDLGLLDDVNVISGVSGGSMMTGILGYSHEDFAEIDKKTFAFLRRGLVKPGLCKLFHPKRLFPLIVTTATATLPTMLVNTIMRIVMLCISLFPGGASSLNQLLRRVRWPLPYWFTRTHVIRDAISDVLGDILCNAPTRNDKAIVFNACELRTGTAFRMSNERYGSCRFGSASASKLSVADAVAASASYPSFLPPFEWNKRLTKNNQTKFHRLIITDGGIYENLGISALESDSGPTVRVVNYTPDIIIASDASFGQMTGLEYPVSLSPRLSQAFSSVMRKVNDASKKRLHKLAENGEIHSYVYANLGQIDNRVILKAPGWIAREDVMNYPTNFSAMSEKNIQCLAGRGEAITRTLVTQYLLSD